VTCSHVLRPLPKRQWLADWQSTDLALPERRKSERVPNAVLRYSARPRHPSCNPAERHGAVPWTARSAAGPVGAEARVRTRYCAHEVWAPSSIRPERATQGLLCCQRQRCVGSGWLGCCVKPQRSAGIGPRVAALGVPDRWFLCGLTFELTPRAEAGGVSPGCDDSTSGAAWAYTACRSESGVERVVRHHWAAGSQSPRISALACTGEMPPTT